MSTMLATQNPEEAARIEVEGNKPLADAAAAAAELAETGGLDEVAEVAPVSQEGMPQVSDWVLYQPRRGEVRRGRNRVPALVIAVHPGTRLVDLVLVYDANDVGDQQRVPEAVDDERGWLLKPEAWGDLAALRREISELRALVLGEFDAPERSILSMLDDVDARVDALGVTKPPDRSKPAAKKKAKRGK